MNKLTRRVKQVLIDLLGVILIILSLVFGWLPGVAGIPLFIAGLALLALNHEWARQWLMVAENKGEEIWDIVFRDNAQLKWFYDISGTLIVVWAIYVFSQNLNNHILGSFSIFFISIGSLLLIGNRGRLKRLKNFYKDLFKK